MLLLDVTEIRPEMGTVWKSNAYKVRRGLNADGTYLQDVS